MPNRSCATNPLHFTFHVIQATESEHHTDVLSVDFSIAFDRVPHHLLIQKLLETGLNSTANSWLSSYLTDRKWSGGNSMGLNKNNYNIGGAQLERIRLFSDLGVFLDEKLTFTAHYDVIRAKSFALLGFIKRTCYNMHDPDAIKSLFAAFVQSRLEFARIVWQLFYAIHISRIESIQKQFLLYALRRLPWRDRFALQHHEDRCLVLMFDVLRSDNYSQTTIDLFQRNSLGFHRTNCGLNMPQAYSMRLASANSDTLRLASGMNDLKAKSAAELRIPIDN